MEMKPNLVIRLKCNDRIVRTFEIPLSEIPNVTTADYWRVDVSISASEKVLVTGQPLPPWGSGESLDWFVR